jgi:hypothetical protein
MAHVQTSMCEKKEGDATRPNSRKTGRLETEVLI